MIVDSSGLIAIVNRESDAGRNEEAMIPAPYCRMPGVNFIETSTVAEGRDGRA